MVKFAGAIVLVAAAIMLLLSGCGTVGVSYKYYGLDATSYEGSLRGPTEADDAPFARCAPTEGNKSPCVVMFADEFFRMKMDLQESKDRLQELLMNN